MPHGQAGTVTIFESNVTAPAVCARALPFSVAPVASVIEASDRMLPLKVEVVPRTAELPTCQKMLWAEAPPASLTLLPLKVVSPEAIWKIQTAFALPCPSRVTVPLIANVDVDL
jgi:hypothetical protein